jgi:hypothetical protein
MKVLIYWQKHTLRKNREALLVYDKDAGVEVNNDKLITDVLPTRTANDFGTVA